MRHGNKLMIVSRPASSGGGEPAPGENGFLILSMIISPPASYTYLYRIFHISMYKSIEPATLFRNSGDEFQICHSELLPDITGSSEFQGHGLEQSRWQVIRAAKVCQLKYRGIFVVFFHFFAGVFPLSLV
jgi:hypothetical protein